jgi:alkylation response protein AidB-like acyl-CoA dehydrogenase
MTGDLDVKDLFGASPSHVERSREATRNYLFHRSATIAGGTSEIQRNIIASYALGL